MSERDPVLEAEIREAAHHVVTLLEQLSERINYPFVVNKANKEARDIIESRGGVVATAEQKANREARKADASWPRIHDKG